MESDHDAAQSTPVSNNLQPVGSIQLQAEYSHVRIGTYNAEPYKKCVHRPLIVEPMQKCKKNTRPGLRLLKHRQNLTPHHSTKSCDNIYAINKSSNSLDWRLGNTINYQGLRASQSNSLDWRIGRTVAACSDQVPSQCSTRSAEQLSQSTPSSLGYTQAPNTKSKLVSFLRRLSPRLARPRKNSPQLFPAICPWVQVEYTAKLVDENGREESQEIDTSFQQEMRINEVRKKIAESSAPNCASKTYGTHTSVINAHQTSYPSIRIEGPENYSAPCNSRS